MAMQKKTDSTFWQWYNQYLKSDEWKNKKDEFLKHFAENGVDVPLCEKCSGIKKLNVHHIHYDNVGSEKVDEDLCLLCEDCHNEWHKKESEFTAEEGVEREELFLEWLYGDKWFEDMIDEVIEALDVNNNTKPYMTEKRRKERPVINRSFFVAIRKWASSCRANKNYKWTKSDNDWFNRLDILESNLNHNMYICQRLKQKKVK